MVKSSSELMAFFCYAVPVALSSDSFVPFSSEFCAIMHMNNSMYVDLSMFPGIYVRCIWIL